MPRGPFAFRRRLRDEERVFESASFLKDVSSYIMLQQDPFSAPGQDVLSDLLAQYSCMPL